MLNSLCYIYNATIYYAKHLHIRFKTIIMSFAVLKRLGVYFAFAFCFINTTCDDEEVVVDRIECNYDVTIDKDKFNNLNSDAFNLVGAEIIGDCLFMSVMASGCSGDSWQYALVDSEAVAESLPEQRYLKFQLTNEELCLAVFEKTISFNLSSLQIQGSNEIILNIDGLKTPIPYKY